MEKKMKNHWYELKNDQELTDHMQTTASGRLTLFMENFTRNLFYAVVIGLLMFLTVGGV